METVTISPKYQVVISQKIRERLGLRSGEKVRMIPYNGRVEIVFPTERATGATPDPFDEMVLECALAAAADCIVTGDKKHLLPLGHYREIPILTSPEQLEPWPSQRCLAPIKSLGFRLALAPSP